MNPKEQDLCSDWHLNNSFFYASENRSQSDPYIVQSLRQLNSFQRSEPHTSPPSPVILHSSSKARPVNLNVSPVSIECSSLSCNTITGDTSHYSVKPRTPLPCSFKPIIKKSSPCHLRRHQNFQVKRPVTLKLLQISPPKITSTKFDPRLISDSTETNEILVSSNSKDIMHICSESFSNSEDTFISNQCCSEFPICCQANYDQFNNYSSCKQNVTLPDIDQRFCEVQNVFDNSQHQKYCQINSQCNNRYFDPDTIVCSRNKPKAQIPFDLQQTHSHDSSHPAKQPNIETLSPSCSSTSSVCVCQYCLDSEFAFSPVNSPSPDMNQGKHDEIFSISSDALQTMQCDMLRSSTPAGCLSSSPLQKFISIKKPLLDRVTSRCRSSSPVLNYENFRTCCCATYIIFLFRIY